MAGAALMYHDVRRTSSVNDAGFDGAAPDVYALDWTSFIEHLEALRQVSAGDPGAPSCVLTFDDAGSSSLDVAHTLAERGLQAYFFAPTAFIGQPRFATAADLRAIRSLGHRVGSHSHTHPERISSLEPDAIAREWSTSVELLAEILGEPVTSASIPGGYSSASVIAAAASAGIRCLFTSEPTMRTGRTDGCVVHGRYAIRSNTSTAQAVALATGAGTARARQAAAWKARAVAKTVLGDAYPRLRRAILRRRADGT